MISFLVLASTAAITAAPTSSLPTAPTPTVVVTGHKIKDFDGKVKVDSTVYVDDEDVSERYGTIWPSKAFNQQMSGRVVLACRVNALGFAQSCDVDAEMPLNLGFGQAALQLQPSLRVAPPANLEPGGSVVMKIAIRFDAPDDTLDGAGSASQASAASGGKVYQTSGKIEPHSGRPMIMQEVTMMDHPIWSAAPSFEDVRKVYPIRTKAPEGFVVLRCNVEHSGSLWGCDVSKERPEKEGFDKAALSLAPLFHVAPEVMAKAPNKRALQVVVPIRFAPTELAAEPVVQSPSWVSGFDPQAMPKVFPSEAAARGLTTGRGIARCVVGADGALTSCSPDKAEPDASGFSEAAVVLASTMKMNLWSVDAGPVRGGVIRVPIRLNLAPQ